MPWDGTGRTSLFLRMIKISILKNVLNYISNFYEQILLNNYLKMQNTDNSPPEYSIIVPTYNEKENIGILIWMINKYLTER
jgi:hypothetical protein